MKIRDATLRAASCAALAVAAVGCGSAAAQAPSAANKTLPARTDVSHSAARRHGALNLGGGKSAPTATATKSGPPASRPREQLDETSAQLSALYAPYYQCLAKHVDPAIAKLFAKKHIHTEPWKLAGPAGLKACLPYKPLPPWQYDPANPKALGFVEQVVACLHKRGVQYAQVVDPPGADEIEVALGGSQNDARSISLGLQYTPSCNEQVLKAQTH